MIKDLEEIVKRLEEIYRVKKVKSLNYAIDFLKLAILEIKFGIESKCRESLLHYLFKERILDEEDEIKGIYFEAKDLKLQKYGYRPDIVLIKDDEIIFVEAEIRKYNVRKKIERIKKFLNRIKSEKNLEPILKSIISGERKLRIIFVTKDDINIDEKIDNIEIEIIRMMNNPVPER